MTKVREVQISASGMMFPDGLVGDGVTSDQAVIVATVAAAYAAGASIYWPLGTFLTTATIPNFHDVRHYGPGIIKRGSDLWYITPTVSQTRTVYISTAGADPNDGLSASQPITTWQHGLDVCGFVSNYCPGAFTLQAAASQTYTVLSELTYTKRVFMRSTVTFSGAVDGSNVPTVVIFGSNDGTRTHDFCSLTQFVRFTFQNLFFKSFENPISASQYAILTATNIYSLNCRRTVSLGNAAFGNISMGLWDHRDLSSVLIPTSIGFSSVIGSFYNMTQPDDYSGLKIIFADRADLNDELSDGHKDNMQYEDCNIGVEFTRGYGSANMSGAKWKRCTIGIRARGGSLLQVSNTQDFGTGADACPTPIQWVDGATNASVEDFNYDSRRAPTQVHARTNATTITGNTNENTVWSPFQFVGGRMTTNDFSSLILHGTDSGGLAGTATMRVKVGASTVASFDFPVGCSKWRAEVGMTAVTATDIRGQVEVMTQAGSSAGISQLITIGTTTCVSLTAETPVVVTIQLTNAADAFLLAVGRAYSTVAGVTV